MDLPVGVNGMRTIFHIDVNSAFLSWEAVRRRRDAEIQGLQSAEPDLRDIPSIIGGDPSRRTSIGNIRRTTIFVVPPLFI